jgi:7,8-dihydropterin-6-yl-methyl-4-(beta-D-ribofuranosyl)aminobenzene 5'-phosphate synthase
VKHVILGLLTLACACAPTKPTPTESNVENLEVTPERGPAQPMVDSLSITILSDMVPGRKTTAEWGFSALVQVASGGVSKRFLFDTGGAPQTVIFNAKQLNVDLCSIEDVVLSHNHSDHTLGLNTLRSSCLGTNPNAFKNAYVGGDEIFWPRIKADGSNDNVMVAEKVTYEAQGGRFIVNSAANSFLVPGMWLTGKISRTHDEKTYPGTPSIKDPSGSLSSDTVPEEQSLVVNTATGLVVVTGCAHAGIINTLEQAHRMMGGGGANGIETTPVRNVTLVGGLHLLQRPLGDGNTEATVKWVSKQMRHLNVTRILGSHCTGFERFIFLRDDLDLDPTQAVFSTVGTVFSAATGFAFTSPAVNLPLQ